MGVVPFPLLTQDGEIAALTLIDEDDYERVRRSVWRLSPQGYAVRYIKLDKRVACLLHRVVTGAPGGLEGDHVNRNRLDNRQVNLRVVTLGQNRQNRASHRGSRSRYRGVSWNAVARAWTAIVQVNRQRVHFSRHASEHEAAVAAEAARRAHMTHAEPGQLA